MIYGRRSRRHIPEGRRLSSEGLKIATRLGPVELRGLEPLAFWMQTIFLACFYVAGSSLTGRLPAEIVADCQWASLGIWLRWLFSARSIVAG
jgi:hypothetical protein